MRFKDQIAEALQEKLDHCNLALNDPARLEALRRTGLMDTPSDEAFDRLARLAARLLNAPLTIISLVGDRKQFFKAGHGLPSPFDQVREVPIDDSICRYTLKGEAIIAGDASRHELLSVHPTTEPWGIGAFIALPMMTEEGHVLGAFCAVDSRPRPWSDDDVNVLRELTASVMTEIHLRTRVRELESERDLRERFVAALSHDLRTPLTAAKMCAQLLARKIPESVDLRKLSVRIVDNMDRADQMIRDLLDASRIKAGERLSLELQDCDLQEIATEVLEDLGTLYGDRFVLLTESTHPVRVDRTAVRRMLENLATNAVKYGSPGTAIRIQLENTDHQVHISVHNEGNPIPPADQESLFDPYQRLPSAITTGMKGWGIGLTLVRGLAEAHGGAVRVNSSSEKGTTFMISLPQQS